MARIATRLLLLVALCLGISELGTRTILQGQLAGTNRLEDFYLPVSEAAANRKIDILFVGTSRVAEAVSAQVVAGALADSAGTLPHVLNVGKGYSTLVLHYFGLQRLYREHPDKMRGALVMIEAPSGIPLYREWSDGWVLDGWPTLMGPLLSAQNVVPFLTQSANALDTKLYALASGPLKSVRYARYFQPKLETLVNERFKIGSDQDSVADLSTAGGVRADSIGVALVRNRVLEGGQEEPDTTIWSHWGESVLADIVQLVRGNGGDVLFYEMPESSFQSGRYPESVRSRGREAFEQWALEKNLRTLRFPSFQTSDDDFPDLMHLRASLSGTYSTLIARELLRSGYYVP